MIRIRHARLAAWVVTAWPLCGPWPGPAPGRRRRARAISWQYSIVRTADRGGLAVRPSPPGRAGDAGGPLPVGQCPALVHQQGQGVVDVSGPEAAAQHHQRPPVGLEIESPHRLAPGPPAATGDRAPGRPDLVPRGREPLLTESANWAKITSANGARYRLALPGTASGLSSAVGTPLRQARQTTGPAAKPPRPSTAAAGRRSCPWPCCQRFSQGRQEGRPGEVSRQRGGLAGGRRQSSAVHIRRSISRLEPAKTTAPRPAGPAAHRPRPGPDRCSPVPPPAKMNKGEPLGQR